MVFALLIPELAILFTQLHPAPPTQITEMRTDAEESGSSVGFPDILSETVLSPFAALMMSSNIRPPDADIS